MATKPKGLLIDITRCIGCDACSENCKKVNDLPGDVAAELDSDNYTVVYDRGEGRYARNLCRHCHDPACVSACPVSALIKQESGAVLYDEDRCLGCRYCMTACPFRILTFEWYSWNPRIRKCVLCDHRIQEGKSTGCAEACPTEATVFGDREELVAMAKARIAANPDGYYDHIYGMEEAGGTSVMFLSPVPFEELGFDTNVPTFPLPDITWRIMKTVPPTFIGVGVLMGISYFHFKRRNKVREAEGGATVHDRAGKKGGAK